MQTKFSKVVEEVVTWLAFALFLSLLVLLFVQVVLRYGFNSGLSWIEEYSTFCFVWISMLGIALGVKKNAHLAMDALVDRFPETLRKYSDILNKLLCIAFFSLLLYSGVLYTKVGAALNSPVMKVSYALLYISIPVMCGLSILFLIISLVHEIVALYRAEVSK